MVELVNYLNLHPVSTRFGAALLLLFALFLFLYLSSTSQKREEQRIELRSLAIIFSVIAALLYSKAIIIPNKLLLQHPIGEEGGIMASMLLTLSLLLLPIEAIGLQRQTARYRNEKRLYTLFGLVLLLIVALEVTAIHFSTLWGSLLFYTLVTTISLYTARSLMKSMKRGVKREKRVVWSSEERRGKTTEEATLSSMMEFYLFDAMRAIALLFGIVALLSTLLKVEFGGYHNLMLLLVLLNFILLCSIIGECEAERKVVKQSNIPMLYHTSSEVSLDNQLLRERLIEYFAIEKPYLDSTLNIDRVSKVLYSNKSYLSRMINETFNSNFCQLVNFYRIEEAKELYSENNNLSIQQLCEKSGFGSTATFNMSFKLFTGKTPSEWCKHHKIAERSAKYKKKQRGEIVGIRRSEEEKC